MKLVDSTTGPRGYVKIRKIFTDGSEELHYEGENLIVILGKSIVLGQMYYSSGNGDPLSYAKIGTGGAIDIDGNFLKNPTVDLTDLYTPIATASILKTAEDLSVPSITLVAAIDNSVANGQYINEAGFFSASGKMFNIKTFPRVLKKNTFSLNIEWVLKMF